MIRYISLTILALLSFTLSFGQSGREIDSLLSGLYSIKNSKELSKSPEANKLMALGIRILPLLATHFADSTPAWIYSDCQNMYLTRGEVAIIMADRIELMPYAYLTGIQNCMMEFCKDNPNLIEIYLWAIRRDSVTAFSQRYTEWLNSKDRLKWPPYISNKAKKRG